MILKILISFIVILPILASAENADLLRFDNGDQLHGEFLGFGEKKAILWKRNTPDDKAIEFNPADIRQVILKSGKPERALTTLSYIGLINGDRIPGTIQEIDDKRALIQTDVAGLLEIPRDQIAIIAPNPMGGRVLYHGPFDKTEWTQRTFNHSKGIPKGKDDAKIEKESPLWKFSGSAWYWKEGRMGTAITRDTGMTDRSVLQFDISWKNRLSLAVAFHADFKTPEKAAPVNGPVDHGQPSSMSNLPNIFGSSYILHLYSNYVVLYRAGFDEDGRSFMNRLQSKSSSLRLSNSGSAKVEIRCNRNSGGIMLFVDGEFVCDWKEKSEIENNSDAPSNEYVGKGAGYGFMVQMDDSPLRVSDIIVADWNGIPDSARSLESDITDIVLLTNGTDRFSGKISSVKDGKVNLSGRFGNFAFPTNEIAEIRFAKSQLKAADESKESDFKVKFHPHGSISGKIISGNPKNIRLNNSAAGEINIDMNSASMLDFKSMESYLDDWNVEF
jgi:hypothetical protein